MKTRILLIILSLLILSGCSNVNSNATIAKTAVEYMQNKQQYTFSIVQTKEYSATNGKKSGIYDLVVYDSKGVETCRKLLNQYFDNKELLFDDSVNIIASDYNHDQLFDIPIGLPDGDGSTEYKYVIFSVGKDGKLFTLPVKGYKKDGFIYTAAGDNSIEFTKIIGTGEGKKPGILVGIEKSGGGFEPAQYVWDGKQFQFKKETPFPITEADLLNNGHQYSVLVIQVEYIKPRTHGEPGFSIYESMYRGRFDILVRDNRGEVTSRIPLNKYFGNDELAFGGTFSLEFRDYNKDGNNDFAIGRPDEGGLEFQYALFSINSEGGVYNLPAVGYKKDGFLYSAETQSAFPLLNDGELGIKITLSKLSENGYAEGKYVWNGSSFVFSNTTN